MYKNSLYNLMILLNSLSTTFHPDVYLISEVILQFSSTHNVIIHYDNFTSNNLDLILTRVPQSNCYLTINYDNDLKDLFTRPTGYKFLHIVLLNDYQRLHNFELTSRSSLTYIDIVFLINYSNNNLINQDTNEVVMERLSSSNSFQYWNENILYKVGALFIFNLEELYLYNVCFYCGKMSTYLQRIENMTIDEETKSVTIPDLANFINKFENFHQHEFLVGYNIYKPLFFGEEVEKEGNHTINEGKGTEYELLFLFHEHFNFSLVLIPYSSYNKSWTAVVEAVSKNILDWAIAGITLTIPRTKIVDFTTRIKVEPYSVLYGLYDDPWLSWRNILLPFQFHVWALLTASVFVISFLLKMTIKTSHHTKKVTISYFISSWMRLLFEQSVPFFHKSLKSRITTAVLICLYFASALIINYSYKSKLTSSLINSRATEYDVIDQLVDKGYNFLMNDFDSTVLQENLKLSNDPKYLEALRRSNNKTDFCDAVLKTIGQKNAIIDEGSLIQNLVQEKCSSLMSIEHLETLRLITDDLFPSTHAWPMQLNTPFRAAFNTVIMRLQAAGLFVKWSENYVEIGGTIPKSHQRHTKMYVPRFNLASLLGPAIIWTTGMILAIIIFIIEIFWKR